MTTYAKPALDAPAQLAQWQGRGLMIADVPRAEHYLAAVGYYRLSAYSLPFQVGNPDHHFIPNTRFDDVLDLYIFDRELRLLVLDAIERIEVAIRSHIGNYMATKYGPHWYLDESHFKPEHELNPDTLARYKKNRLRVVPELVYSPWATEEHRSHAPAW